MKNWKNLLTIPLVLSLALSSTMVFAQDNSEVESESVNTEEVTDTSTALSPEEAFEFEDLTSQGSAAKGTTIADIDMTAEDILQKNPRYLTRSKSFDTFFSFGPELVTADEVEDVHRLEVSTIINGELHRKNAVANMMFTPWKLVSFHSKVMTLLPGDIISTGTPGAVVIRDGDVVTCDISGFAPLSNPVKDLKKSPIHA